MQYPFHTFSAALLAVILSFSVLPAAAQEGDNDAATRAAIARVEARFSAVEEQLRQMRGKLEEVEYENRRLREQVDLYQQDANIRFTELEDKTRGNASGTTAAAVDDAPQSEKQPAASADAQQLKLPNPNAERFESPREHYNYAFGLLNKTQYAEASDAFEGFIAAYPQDPLIGNAYYWAGETYYVREDYVRAADYFRRGYEAMKEGPKAGDNLLKLAMSLAAMERSTESCVVLKQVLTKFSQNSTTLKQKATSERNRLGCK